MKTSAPGPNEIEELLATLARLSRLGDYGEAASVLNKTLAGFERMQADGTMNALPVDLVKKFNYSLETIFLLLKNKDWVGIADVVEYELIDIWRVMSIPPGADRGI